MSGQVQKNASKSSSSSAPSTTKPKDLSAKAEELKEKADAVKDEIDALLDEVDEAMKDALGNTEVKAFLDNFIQRGGQVILISVLTYASCMKVFTSFS